MPVICRRLYHHVHYKFSFMFNQIRRYINDFGPYISFI